MNFQNRLFYTRFIFAFLLINSIAFGQDLSKQDLEYYKSQNAVLSSELVKYFDLGRPDFHSIERKNALYLIDAITHYPTPHDEYIKQMFLDRYKKAIASIKETQVQSGIAIWNIYNMSYVVKSSEITIAFDLTRLPPSLRTEGKEELYKNMARELVNSCEMLFISHVHQDHADAFVAEEFISQNKPVISNPDIFKKEDFFEKVIHLQANAEKVDFQVEGADVELGLRIYPGHQAISAEAAVDNNFTIVTLPNNITLAHSGDQSWRDDFEWIDSVHKDLDIDILMVNTWTLWPDRLVAGLQPEIIFPGHLNEMSHPISSRIPYWKSYQSWQNNEDRAIHLFWGETFLYHKKSDNYSK